MVARGLQAKQGLQEIQERQTRMATVGAAASNAPSAVATSNAHARSAKAVHARCAWTPSQCCRPWLVLEPFCLSVCPCVRLCDLDRFVCVSVSGRLLWRLQPRIVRLRLPQERVLRRMSMCMLLRTPQEGQACNSRHRSYRTYLHSRCLAKSVLRERRHGRFRQRRWIW